MQYEDGSLWWMGTPQHKAMYSTRKRLVKADESQLTKEMKKTALKLRYTMSRKRPTDDKIRAGNTKGRLKARPVAVEGPEVHPQTFRRADIYICTCTRAVSFSPPNTANSHGDPGCKTQPNSRVDRNRLKLRAWKHPLWGPVGFSCLTCDLAEVTWPIPLTRHQRFERHGLKPCSQSAAAGSTVHCHRWQKAWTTCNIDGLPSPLRIEGLYK